MLSEVYTFRPDGEHEHRHCRGFCSGSCRGREVYGGYLFQTKSAHAGVLSIHFRYPERSAEGFNFGEGRARDKTSGAAISGTQPLGRWFNAAAFQTAPGYTFGNSPRSVLRGAFLNALNHANFGIPGHALGNADFGVTSAAEPARTLQVALRLIF